MNWEKVANITLVRDIYLCIGTKWRPAGLTELPAFAEQWLRKRRYYVISSSFITVVSSEKNETLECM